MAWSGARQIPKAAAAIADAVRRPVPGLVVLIYHRVGRRSGIEVDLPLATFAEQVAFLAARTTVVSIPEGLARVVQPHAPPEPLVAVTFDDGTADFADLALPVLIEHRIPVMLYLATDFVDRGVPFPGDGRPLSWQSVRDVVATGLVELGSHTHRRALLDRLPEAEIADELDRSIELIQEHVGVRAEHFAYPKAVPGSAAADAAVRARFRSAALAGTRANRYGATDPYRLMRSPVQRSDGVRWFEHKVAGGLAWEDTMRRVVNRGRDAGLLFGRGAGATT